MIKISFLAFLFFITINSFAKNLEDSTLAVKDSLENETLKDTVDLKVPEGLTARDVIKNYVTAIGGADKIYGIIDRTTIMTGSVQGVDISILSYQKAPNKLKQQIKAGSNEQVIIFDGEKGIMKMAGEEEEIKDGELEKLKFESTLTLLTDIDHYGINLKLDGIEKVDGENAYKVIMTLPSGLNWTQYYDIKSGLKIKELKYIKSYMGLFQQEISYSDYEEAGGVLYPFKIKQTIGAQGMEFTVSSITVNTGLTDREFEIN